MLSETCRKVLKILIQTAKKGEVITYQELAHLSVGQDIKKQPKVSWLFKVLGNISHYTYQESGILITALVVNKDTGTPGIGFLQLAGIEMSNSSNAFMNSDNFIRNHIKCIHSVDPKNLDKLLAS